VTSKLLLKEYVETWIMLEEGVTSKLLLKEYVETWIMLEEI